MTIAALLVALITMLANLVILGLCIKLYTEFIKEKKYRQP